MKRFFQLCIIAVLCASLSVSVFASPTQDHNHTDNAGGFDTNGGQGGPTLSGSGMGVALENTNGDFQEAVNNGFQTGDVVDNKDIPSDSPLYYDPFGSESSADYLARMNAIFYDDPYGFAAMIGFSREQLESMLAAGECPTLNFTPQSIIGNSAAGNGPMSAQQYISRLANVPDSYLNDSKFAGKTNADIMNILAGEGKIDTGLFGTPPGVAGSENRIAGSIAGFLYKNGRFEHQPNKVAGSSNLSSEGGRAGNAYFNLCDAIDPLPEHEEEPPPPTVTEAGPLQEWKSKPLAFGEVKHNEYSVGRTAEEWEAMAGIPHDETLFLDEGGSTFSAHFKTEDAQDFFTSKPTVPSPKTECVSVPCPNGFCKAGGPHCDVHPTCYDHPCSHGSPPNVVSYSSGHCAVTCCSHKLCYEGSRKHSISVTFKMPEEIKNYYPMRGIDVRWMDSFKESLAWANPASITMDADKLTATVVWDSTHGPGSDGFQGIASSYDCKIETGCKPFAQAVVRNLNRWRGEKFSWFLTQTLNVMDRDSNSHEVMWDNDLEFYTVSWDELEQCESTTVVVKMKGSKVGERQVSEGETITYPADSIHEDRLPKKQTNFLPYEEEWSTTDKISICGYNGLYSNPRRHYHGSPGDKHFFMQSGITISDIVNGEKTSGPGKLDFGPQSGGRHSNFFWGSDVNAEDNATTEYYRGAGKVNNVVVHSPVALSQFYHTVPNLPFDQRYVPGPQGDVYFTPSLDFNIHSSIDWGPQGIQTTEKGIASTTEDKGNGYYTGRDTSRWIDSKYYSFPFEVIYNGTRYGTNDWIPIPVTESRSTFTLPVSEKESKLVEYRGVVIAKNEPDKNPEHVYSADSEYQQNYERDSSPHGSSGKEAMHGANNKNQVSILGKIGNFAVEYTDDPNWSPFFSKTVSGWQIPNVLQNVDIKQPNKFIGPHRDIFDRVHWSMSGDLYTSVFPWGLDHYAGVPTLGKDLMGAILPAGEGKNNESYNNLLQYKPIKLGYTAWWSIQTIGNYDTAETKLKAQPQFYLFDPLTPDTKQYVDVWTKVGSMYRRIYDHTGKTDAPAYTLDYVTKLNQPERRIGDVEKERTSLVVGVAEFENLFGERVSVNFGSPNGMTLQQNLRTFIGGTMWEDVNHQPNAVDRSEADHARQVQRWHGTIYLPASSKFTKPGEKDFLQTQVLNGSGKPVRNLLIGVEFVFKTEGAAPWNIWTKDSIIVGSNLDGYKPWIKVVPPETPDNPHDPSDPPTIVIDMPPPPNVPITFDPNENSLQDISLHGTH